MTTVASLLVRIGADISDFENKMKGASTSLKQTGENMTQIGGSLTKGVTLPLTALGTGIVTVGANFERQMSRVQAISGATAKEFQELTKQAEELGSSTQFSAKQAGEGMEFLARAGFSVEETLGAMPGLLNLAASSSMDLGAAADIASNIMSGFSINANEAGRVADVLAKAASSANTSVGQLGEGMKFVAPIAETLNISMEETTAAIGLMSDAGIQAGQAGRTLRSALTKLVKPSETAIGVMDELNFSATNSQGQFKSLSQLVGDFTKTTEGMTEAQIANKAAILFGQEAASGFLALVSRGEEDLSNFTTALENSEGSSQRMAETIQDNLGGSLIELKSALEGIAIEFYENIAPALTNITDLVTKAVRGFSSLSEGTQNLILVFGGIVTALGPVLLILGKLAGAISSIITIYPTLVAGITSISTSFAGVSGASASLASIIGGISFAPLIAVLGAVITASIAVYKNWDKLKAIGLSTFKDIKDIAINTFKSLENLFKSATTNTNNLVSVVIKSLSNWKETFKSLEPVFNQIVLATKESFNFITKVLEEFFKVVKVVFSGFSSIAISTFNGILASLPNFINAFKSAFKLLGNILGAVIAIIRGDWSSAWELGANAVISAKDIIVNVVKGLLNFIKEFGITIVNIFKGIGINITDITKRMLEGIKGYFTNILGSITGFLDKWSNKVSGIFSGLKKVLVGSSIVPDMVTDISGEFNFLDNEVSNTLSSFKDNSILSFNNLKDSATSKVSNLATNVISNFTDLSYSAEDSIRNLVSQSINQFGIMDTDIGQKIATLKDSTINKITSLSSSMSNILKSLKGNSKDIFSSLVIESLANFTFLDRKSAEIIGTMAGKLVSKVKSLVSDLGEGLKNIASSIWSEIKSIVNKAISIITSPIENIKKAFQGIKNIGSSVVSGAKNLLGKIGGFLGFAEGGIVTRPTLGVIGEKGAEAVIPLDKLNKMFNNSNSNINITQNFNNIKDPQQVQRATERAFRKVALQWGIADGRI